MKIMITVPCYENIFPDTMKCIWDLRDANPDVELCFEFVRGYSVDRARNLCVRKAIEAGADKILFVDNDMTFDASFLGNLIEDDLPVVMGYYDHRSWEDEPDKHLTNLCKTGQFHYKEQITTDEVDDAWGEGYDLVEIKGGGLGFCLIDLSIFRNFTNPWFKFVEYPDGQCLSEDLFFAEQCKRLGIKMYADTRCYCGHIFRKVHGGAK